MVRSADEVRRGKGTTGALYPTFMFLCAFLAGGAFLAASPSSSSGSSSRVSFDHARHVDWGLGCDACHMGVYETARAVIPRKALCARCHSRPVLGTEGEARLLGEIRREGELLWPDPRFLPEHVIFSHRRHTVFGGVSCEECHGPVGRSTTLPERPSARRLDMGACIACHEERRVRRDCFDCHG